MSLFGMPFVGTGADTALHVIAFVGMVGTICAIAVGFWKIHELPINKAHEKEHSQVGLITVLTWIGFVWHWVWVLAVFVAFVDGEKALTKVRDIWHETPTDVELQTVNEQPLEKEVSNHA
ncbi:MFS transporter [Shewanella sp. VB17]|uniref:MFS transporter n=1 Tax=Shewanella sp. VB17 TaxID=2739432 RepID=UPI0015654E02|nr:MFS transporter [Shewanella sp. VB17]NRD72287.1 MFS transporter [Shewanella sp. VB17]